MANGERILIVDDEPQIREVLKESLSSEGYIVAESGTKAELFEHLKTAEIRLITLDLNLGNEDGMLLAREVRSKYNIPIIMITGRDRPLDRVAGLELGADDYITKPFHIREVIIRVRTVLERYSRRAEPTGAPEFDGGGMKYHFDGCVFDPSKYALRNHENHLVHLTETEFEILKLLVSHPGRVWSRDEIMRALKGQDWSPLDRTIDGHVARLRRKIDAHGDDVRLIRSVRGVGYVFVGEVWTEDPRAPDSRHSRA